jgi:MFS family permease
LRSRWLRINRDVKILVFSLFLWEIGLTLYDSLLPIHLRRLGATPEQVGLVFSLAYLIVAISSLPGGWLADRFERRRVMLFFWIIGAPSVLIMAAAQNWFQTLPGIALYFFSFMTFPAINAYVTDASEKSQLSIAFALLYATFPAAQLLGPSWVAILPICMESRSSSWSALSVMQSRRLCCFYSLRNAREAQVFDR